MRFINPKTDFAFKKIFGSAGSQKILRSFLNAVLYDAQPRIVTLEILDPYSVPRLQGMKDSYLDVRAVLDDGQHVIIEMQVLNVPGVEKRILYNAAKEYSNQLLKGQDYRLLNPVIALTLTDFIMFPELPEQVISRFTLMEKDKLIRYPEGDVELVFVELPKFQRELPELRGLTDEWLFFVDRASELTEIPDKLGAVEEIEDAFEIAESARLSPEEDHALEQKSRWIADQKLLLSMKLTADAATAQALEQVKQEMEKAEQLAQKAKQLSHEVKQLGQKAEQEALRAEQLGQKAEQEALRAEQLGQKAEQEALRAEQLGQKAEQEALRAEQEAVRAQTAENKASAMSLVAMKTLHDLGLDADAIAEKLGLVASEVRARLGLT